MKKLLSLITVLSLLCAFLPKVQAGFTDADSWTEYDPLADSLSATHGTGYFGSVFDGRYVYYIPYKNGATHHDEVLRYDTHGDFDSVSSWTAHDTAGQGGYLSGVYDGRYVYFVPYYNGSDYFGEIMRYDTQDPDGFTDSGSWTYYDPGAAGLDSTYSVDLDGFYGAIFDGQYIYFVPHQHTTTPGDVHGQMLRFNTDDPDGFEDTGSWEVFNAESGGNLGSSARGFKGAVYDGRYVYYVPFIYAEQVVRYDTQGAFDNLSSWSINSNSATGDAGYFGAGFDGRYIYFSPNLDTDPSVSSTYHSTVLRYDTQGSSTLSTAGNWTAFDPGGASGFNDASMDGYTGAVFDGTYMYFVPWYDGSSSRDEFWMYDTREAFDDISSWEYFELATGAYSGGTKTAVTGDSFGNYIGIDTAFTRDAIYFNDFNTTGDQLKFDVDAERYFVDVTNPRPSKESTYVVRFLPLLPITSGSTITLTFPAEYSEKFDGGGDDIDTGDVTVTAAGIASSSITISDTTQTIAIEITTDNSGANNIVAPVSIEIGGTNFLTNPSTSGIYQVGIDITNDNSETLEQASASVEIGGGSASVGATAIVNEALVMTMDSTSVSLQVDPSVNGGEDKSEGTILTVASNASGGYTIYGKLDDGSGNAQLVSGANSIASSTGENGFSYDATNNASSCSSPDGTKTFGPTAAVLQNGSSQDVGYTEETDSYQHALCYDLNVNYNTPAGVYTGTITYTVVASF